MCPHVCYSGPQVAETLFPSQTAPDHTRARIPTRRPHTGLSNLSEGSKNGSWLLPDTGIGIAESAAISGGTLNQPSVVHSTGAGATTVPECDSRFS
jgi:hypothetical protein